MPFVHPHVDGIRPGCDAQGNSASSASHGRGQQRDILRKEKLDLGKRIREALRMAEVGQKGFGSVKEARSQEGVGLNMNVGWAHNILIPTETIYWCSELKGFFSGGLEQIFGGTQDRKSVV